MSVSLQLDCNHWDVDLNKNDHDYEQLLYNSTLASLMLVRIFENNFNLFCWNWGQAQTQVYAGGGQDQEEAFHTAMLHQAN